MRREINVLCRSIDLAPVFALLPGVSLTALFALIAFSFSEPAVVFCLPIICDGKISSRLLEIFTAPRGEEVTAVCSGVDGRGEDEGLPLVVVAEDNPDLMVDFGSPPTINDFRHYNFNTS